MRSGLREKERYSKKISTEEEREGYLLILKNKLSFFPPVGEKFILTRGKSRTESALESYKCACRGPSLPHEHYFVTLAGVRAGETAILEREDSKSGRGVRTYLLTKRA